MPGERPESAAEQVLGGCLPTAYSAVLMPASPVARTARHRRTSGLPPRSPGGCWAPGPAWSSARNDVLVTAASSGRGPAVGTRGSTLAVRRRRSQALRGSVERAGGCGRRRSAEHLAGDAEDQRDD